VPLFWYFVGILTTVAIGCVLLPWLRTIPGFGKLPVLPWQAPLVPALMIAAALLLYRGLGHPDLAPSTPHPAAASAGIGGVGTGIGGVGTGIGGVGIGGGGTGGAAPSPAMGTSKAGSMQSAILSLEARLAKGGGTSDDWELLAKSYDFTGEPEAAARARRHELTTAGASQ
jgi:hypothetical protein